MLKRCSWTLVWLFLDLKRFRGCHEQPSRSREYGTLFSGSIDCLLTNIVSQLQGRTIDNWKEPFFLLSSHQDEAGTIWSTGLLQVTRAVRSMQGCSSLHFQLMLTRVTCCNAVAHSNADNMSSVAAVSISSLQVADSFSLPIR